MIRQRGGKLHHRKVDKNFAKQTKFSTIIQQIHIIISTYHFYIILNEFQIVKYLFVIFYFWVVIFFEEGDLTAGTNTSSIRWRSHNYAINHFRFVSFVNPNLFHPLVETVVWSDFPCKEEILLPIHVIISIAIFRDNPDLIATNDCIHFKWLIYLSRIMRKPDFCLCENKGSDQLCSNCTAD